MTDPVALLMLQMEASQLLEALASWQPVGSYQEAIVEAAHGCDGLDAQEVQRLRRWAHRWNTLPEGLRGFYSEQAPLVEAASIALWHVLEGQPHRLHPGTCGAVHRLYLHERGSEPPWTLFPRVPAPRVDTVPDAVIQPLKPGEPGQEDR